MLLILGFIFLGFGDKFKPPSANWECPLCMISNKPDVSKCIACETVKPNDKAEAFNRTASSAPNTVPSFSSNGFGEKFKLSAGTWECPTCLLHVSQNLQKCMACETAKPGSASTATDVKSSTHTGTDVKSISPNVNVSSGISASKINFNFSSSSTFHDKFKTTPSTWECEICLVENTSKDNKCKSCDSPKPIISLPVTTSGMFFKIPFRIINPYAVRLLFKNSN